MKYKMRLLKAADQKRLQNYFRILDIAQCFVKWKRWLNFGYFLIYLINIIVCGCSHLGSEWDILF